MATVPQWMPVLLDLEVQTFPLMPASELNSVSFHFLQLEKELSWPIHWNDANWPRLWQFHLHYFDWAREWLELALISGQWPNQAALLEPLIDQWIEANPAGRGDGWHSYTLSLRTRNWIWLFRCCPPLATPSRLKSLWQQLSWLQSHPEHANGGNHWLENLISLAVGGLQFGGSYAEFMSRRALRLLQQELARQVLPDGGHEERSASYHLLMLDRLTELACSISAINGECPSWLVGAIEAMTAWAKSVRFEGGATPRFNDSAADAAPTLDEVVRFADGYLLRRWTGSGLRCKLLNAAHTELKHQQLAPSVFASPVLTDLPFTGWTFLRPGDGWELAFKCGVPCPLHLPGHVHSDQLSVELSYKGQWVISEAGTSIYGNGPERAYERSGAAHNVLQLGLIGQLGEIQWIEPVEVWGGFRAGRKAQPCDRESGELSDGSCFAAGGHDGFDRIGASHIRRVQLSNARPNQITLTVYDMVTTSKSLQFRQWWHLAPGIPNEVLSCLAFEAPTSEAIQTSWHTTWFSEGFGQRTPRQSLCIRGCLPPGKHRLRITLPLSVASLSLPQICPDSG
jgi:uncharacterized heparinase superfamily protein